MTTLEIHFNGAFLKPMKGIGPSTACLIPFFVKYVVSDNVSRHSLMEWLVHLILYLFMNLRVKCSKNHQVLERDYGFIKIRLNSLQST